MIKMKIISAIILVIGMAGAATAQSFEGEITYSNTFTSKVQGLSNERLASYIGNKQEYFIKGGYYKSVMNGLAVTEQLMTRRPTGSIIKCLLPTPCFGWMPP
jgi:hypothetical protein